MSLIEGSHRTENSVGTTPDRRWSTHKSHANITHVGENSSSDPPLFISRFSPRHRAPMTNGTIGHADQGLILGLGLAAHSTSWRHRGVPSASHCVHPIFR